MKGKPLLYGATPVLQCLLNQNRQCFKLYCKDKSPSPRTREIIQLACTKKIPVEKADSHKLANLCDSKLHQGVVLQCSELKTHDLESFLDKIYKTEKKLLVALDQIEDPQNCGAIIRSAAFLGANGLITLKKNAAPLSASVSKASAGALEYLPIIQIGNLSEGLQLLKKEGFTVAGATSGEDSIDFVELPLTDYMVLVMGNEGQGLRKLTQKRCDFLIQIPGNDSTESLNVSAAAAILVHHLTRNMTIH